MEKDVISSTLSTSARSIRIQEDALKEVFVKKDTLRDADIGVEVAVGEMKRVFIYTRLKTSTKKVMKRKVNRSNDHDENVELNRESNDKESDFEENYSHDDNVDQEHHNTEVLTDNFGITTDEILKMYENVELDLDEAEEISAEDIVKMYENVESSDTNYAVKMSTRKLKQKTI